MGGPNGAWTPRVPLVKIEGLWEGYRPKTRRGGLRRRQYHWALRDINLVAHAGEMLGVVGGNGSGKTTLLRSVSGVLKPTRGSVTTTGRVSSLIDLTAGVHRDLTGHENLMIGGVLLGLSRAELRARYSEIVEFTGLGDDLLSEPLHTYSAGMALRQAFAVVLHSDPQVLLVDEVMAVGDEAFHNACLTRIEQLMDAGCAVMFVSHELDLVRARCDRVAVINAGELVFLGAPDAALDHYHALGVSDVKVAPLPERRRWV